jgi:SSS family transporter
MIGNPMSDFLRAWFPGGSGLTASDDLTFVVLLGALVWIGRWAAAGVRTSEDFFLGGRRIPWTAGALALVASEVSALTVLGVPATAFRENWGYLQFFCGAAAARALVAFVFLPAFSRAGATTPYAYLGSRFGPWTRTAGAISFLLTRLLISAVRLLTASVAAGALLGWSPWPTLLLFTAGSIAAQARGGARAAVWTGAFQALVIFGAGLLSIAFLIHRIDGGIGGAWGTAVAAGKLTMFDFGPRLGSPDFLTKFFGEPAVFWVAALTGFVGAAASFGTDHEMTQKAMAVSGRSRSRLAMLAAIGGSFAALLLFLGLGALLFVFYKQNPGMALPDHVDRIFPRFAATVMPRILRGLLLSAIFMASVDSPLASLSTAFIADVVLPFKAAAFDEARRLKWARAAAVTAAVLLAALAVLFSGNGAALSLAFKAGGVCAGPLLGLFFLGLFTRRGDDRCAAVSFAATSALNLFFLMLAENGFFPVSWNWLIVFGAGLAFVLAWAASGRPAAKT